MTIRRFHHTQPYELANAKGRYVWKRTIPAWRTAGAITVVTLAIAIKIVISTDWNNISYAPTKPLSPIAYAAEMKPTITPSPTPTLTIKDRVLMKTITKFGSKHIDSITSLIMGESGFNPYAVNKHSGACGLFQALPCKKMPCALEDVDCQIEWGMNYIARRYGDPTIAYVFWQSNSPHWY